MMTVSGKERKIHPYRLAEHFAGQRKLGLRETTDHRSAISAEFIQTPNRRNSIMFSATSSNEN